MSSDTTDQQTEAGAIAAIVNHFSQAGMMAVKHEFSGQEAPVLILPEGKRAVSIRSFLDEFRETPERIEGEARIRDLDSFISHTRRFADSGSVVFANDSAFDPGSDINTVSPTLTAIFDYHHPESDQEGIRIDAAAEGARWCGHRAVYTMQVSKEWAAWHEADGKLLTQTEFAEFVEEHILDVINPPAEAEKSERLKEIIRATGGNLATQAKLMELSRGLAVHAADTVKSATNLSSGEMEVQYVTEHKDGAGKPIKVPNMFLIAIPVFHKGPRYMLPARLRYRLAGGGIKWFFQLVDADRAASDAFDEVVTKVIVDTSLPVFRGTPERPQSRVNPTPQHHR